MRNTWQLQEARNHLSQVVDEALARGVQVITRHGEPAVVIISIAEYKKLRTRRKSLVKLLRSCPVKDWQLVPTQDIPRDSPL